MHNNVLSASARLLTTLAFIVGMQNTHSQEISSETKDISLRVLAKQSWVDETKTCPLDVMRSPQNKISMKRDECKSPNMSTCFKSCDSGSGESCYWLGQALLEVKAPPLAYETLFQRACKLGITSGCTNRAAGMLNDAPNNLGTNECTTKTFAKGCTFDDPWACTMYAYQLTQGRGVPKNKALALKALEKSCKFGVNDQACEYGLMLKKKIEKSVNGSTDKP
jgi:hypothetical protein